MATMLQRLRGDLDPESGEALSSHTFYASLVGLADGQITRAQIESIFSLTDPSDEAQLDFVINGFQNAADKGRYMNAVHAVFMLCRAEDGIFLSDAQVQAWLTAAEAAY